MAASICCHQDVTPQVNILMVARLAIMFAIHLFDSNTQVRGVWGAEQHLLLVVLPIVMASSECQR